MVKIFSAVHLSSISFLYFQSIKSWPLRMIKLWVGPFLTLRMYIKVKVKRFCVIYLSSISSINVASFKSWAWKVLKLWLGCFFNLTLRQYIKVKVKHFRAMNLFISVISSSLDLEGCWRNGSVPEIVQLGQGKKTMAVHLFFSRSSIYVLSFKSWPQRVWKLGPGQHLDEEEKWQKQYISHWVQIYVLFTRRRRHWNQ